MPTPLTDPAYLRSAPASARAAASSRLLAALEWLGAALIALYVVTFVARNAALQWDLRSCLAAARAALAGADPYVLANLARFSERDMSLPFLYPPIALLPFLGLAQLPAATAALVWIGAKALLLGVLIVTWWKRWTPSGGPLAIALLAVFGWNGSSLWDLRAGNVAIVECALLWWAFDCFVAGRRGRFAALVVAASCFKLVPALFLLLLLVPTGDRPGRVASLSTALAALALLVGGPFLVGPVSHWEGFMRHVPSALTAGEANPSGPALALDLVKALGLGPAAANVAAIGLWLGFAIVVLAASRSWLMEARRARDARRWVMVSVLLATLFAPRPMAYGYLLLAPVALAFAPAPFHTPARRWALVLLLCAQGLARAAHQQPTGLLYTYAPFLLTVSLWALIVRDHATSRPQSPLAGPATT